MLEWGRFNREVSHRPSIFYLAYGSNLSLERMMGRCPDAQVVGTTKIPGYRLLFKKSGSGFYYYKKYFQLPVRTLKGGRLKGNKQCMVYVLHEERLLGEPTMEYYKLLDDGYARWGFDVEVLDKGLSDSIGVKAAKAYLNEYQKL